MKTIDFITAYKLLSAPHVRIDAMNSGIAYDYTGIYHEGNDKLRIVIGNHDDGSDTSVFVWDDPQFEFMIMDDGNLYIKFNDDDDEQPWECVFRFMAPVNLLTMLDSLV